MASYAQSVHVYELDWRSDRISVSVDGVLLYTATSGITLGPMQLLLNLNVEAGGNGWASNQIIPGVTQLPSTLLIDKVEAWTPALTCPN
ncbi:hypothetical protein KRR26_26220 [Corallococcus sp. M34]|uniref:hypothetical protein n=1 Tax=Citreicoccus inhibens TaxID=2849499 RepID=UPI001C2127F1|nr:hypothetical protein [Citreicoccus inhibens]MBU8899114.1 hypothetical protein [Citreicoccus inhibens]